MGGSRSNHVAANELWAKSEIEIPENCALPVQTRKEIPALSRAGRAAAALTRR